MANISNGFTGQLYFRVYLVRNKMKVVRLVFIMRNKLLSIGLLILGFNLLCSHSYAGTSGGIYDMSIFLNEPHPFVKGQKPNSIIDNSIIRNPPKIGSLTDLETSAAIMEKIGLEIILFFPFFYSSQRYQNFHDKKFHNLSSNPYRFGLVFFH